MRTLLNIPIILFLFIFSVSGKEAYKIDVKIDKLPGAEIYLGYHFGSKLYVKDTLILDQNGKGSFKGEEMLKGGLYLIFLPGKTYFDIIIDENQKFGIENDTSEFVKNISFTNSPVNEAFYNYQRFLMSKQNEMGNLRNQKKELENSGNEAKTEEINHKI